MQPSGHRLRDIEHHPLLTDNDNYDSASSSSSEADMADRVWFIRDGCGMVCAVMTWLLVVYADFVVTFVMLLPSKDFWYSVVNGVLFNCLAVLALSSHLRTMLTDPVGTQSVQLGAPAWPVCEGTAHSAGTDERARRVRWAHPGAGSPWALRRGRPALELLGS